MVENQVKNRARGLEVGKRFRVPYDILQKKMRIDKIKRELNRDI